MKKYLIAACLALLAGSAYAGSGTRSVPTSDGANALATADYGGVDIATITFSSSNVLLWGPGSPLTDGTRFPGGSGSIAWIHITSANAASTVTDNIIIRSTGTFNSTTTVSGAGVGSGDYSTGLEVFRIYVGTAVNTSGGYQNQWVSNGSTGFDYVFPKPLRLTNGAMVKPSGCVFGPITIGFTKHGK